MNKNIRWRQLLYHAKHQYWTMNNIVIAVGLVVAISWTWGSISMMQRNYQLQRRLDGQQRLFELTQLEVQTLAYEKAYYESPEYQELSARQHLGLMNPGEKVVVLPANSQAALDFDASEARQSAARPADEPSNLRQWLDFLSGKNSRDLQQ